MAATGKTPILLYGSTTATNQPSAGNLTNSSDGCEIAINVADKNLFFKDATNTVNTVPIRQSSASSDGWLSSTDWSTFNSKQPAGTYVTSVTGTAPVVSSGGTTPAISMAAATGSVNGYLTSTDWTTFNNKQTALVSGTNIKTVSGVSLLGSGDLGTIGTGYGGTGLTSFTANGVVYASSTSALSTGTALNFDGTNLGLGATAASGSGSSSWISLGGTALGGISGGVIYYTGSTAQAYQYVYSGYLNHQAQTGIGHKFFVSSNATASLTIDTSQNVTVDAGNLVIGTSGKGIDFSATAGTGTSELLADYEEGTFTPTVFGGTTAGTATYSTQIGLYTKVGRQVTVTAYINWSSGTGTGSMNFGGLPYTTNSSNFGAGSIWGEIGLAANNTLVLRILNSTTNLQPLNTPVGGGISNTVTYTASGAIMYTATYFV